MSELNAKVRDAIDRIRPLRSDGGGWNKWTVEVDGWGLSAPTRLELVKMLWDWFANGAHEVASPSPVIGSPMGVGE